VKDLQAELVSLSRQSDETLQMLQADATTAAADAAAAREAAGRTEAALRAQVAELQSRINLLSSEKEWASETLAALQARPAPAALVSCPGS
jgi:uncharacterized protein involved in exopolysaccharide biosynthesis